MTMEEAKALCNDARARKGQLREALCFVCGVPFRKLDYEPSNDLFDSCRRIFLRTIERKTGVCYNYTHFEGRSLAGIIRKVQNLEPDTDDDSRVLANFTYIIEHLPDWYIENNYRLSTIDKCFDIIVSKIKRGNGKGKVSDDYKRRVAEELLG